MHLHFNTYVLARKKVMHKKIHLIISENPYCFIIPHHFFILFYKCSAPSFRSILKELQDRSSCPLQVFP